MVYTNCSYEYKTKLLNNEGLFYIVQPLKQNILNNNKENTTNMINQTQSTVKSYKVSAFKILLIINIYFTSKLR